MKTVRFTNKSILLMTVLGVFTLACGQIAQATSSVTSTPEPVLTGKGLTEIEPPGDPFFNINVWSPDSQHLAIAYSQTYMGEFSEPSLYQIQLLDIHTRSLSTLEESSQNTLWPQAWLPGNEITYFTDGDPKGIWSLQIETKAKKFLMESDQAIWSFDGGKIAYQAPSEPKASDQVVLVIRNSSSEQGELTYPIGDQNTTLNLKEWSRDGKQVLFFLKPRLAPEPGLYIFDVEAGTYRLIGDEGYYSGASWSPDGKHIVYTYQKDLGKDFQSELFLTTAQGTCSTKIMDGNGLGISQSIWSPDGKWIAFSWNGGIYLLDTEELWGGNPGSSLTC